MLLASACEITAEDDSRVIRIECPWRDGHSSPSSAFRLPLVSFAFDDVSIDFEQMEVRRAGQRVALAAKEFQLLEYLVLHRDRVLPRKEILQKVWQYDSEVNSRTVDVHIAWLRQKLDHPQNPKHIQTVRGRGYKFAS